MAKPRFFASPAAFRDWLAKHAATKPEVVVGYWKVATGKPSMTWSESVDEALCFGWIDGVRHSLGDDAYTVRFTPRKPTSAWSKVNVAKAKKAIADGRMTPAGLAAFQARKQTAGYSFEQAKLKMPAEAVRALKADEAAWAWWSKAPPSYQKAVAWWLLSAKKEETKARRLAELVREAAAGRTVKAFTRPKPAREGR